MNLDEAIQTIQDFLAEKEAGPNGNQWKRVHAALTIAAREAERIEGEPVGTFSGGTVKDD